MADGARVCLFTVRLCMAAVAVTVRMPALRMQTRSVRTPGLQAFRLITFSMLALCA